MGSPPSLPAPFGGFDRHDPPDWDVDHPNNIGPSENWMQVLFRTSNFDFYGHYLSHSPEKPGRKDREPGWPRVFPDLRQQGWGVVLFSVGKTQKGLDKTLATSPAVKNGLQQPSEGIIDRAKELGREHGNIVKKRAAALGPEAQGAMVVIDNEDQNDDKNGPQTFRQLILSYYDALFDELTVSGEYPAVRAGLYTRRHRAMQLIRRRPDLFVWLVENQPAPSPPDPKQPMTSKQIKDLPFSHPANQLRTPLDRGPLGPALTYPKDRTAILIGRQWMFWQNESKTMRMPEVSLPGLKSIDSFSFNYALVRDPMYPVAQPRFALWENIQLRGFYQKDVVSMHVEQVYQVNPTPLLTPTNKDYLVESDAPLLLVGSIGFNSDLETSAELFTISKKGELVVSTAAGGNSFAAGWRWSSPGPVLDPDQKASAMRRNRALAGVKRSAVDTQIFFVAYSHTLMGIRRFKPSSNWTNPTALANGATLHPFSNIAAVALRGSQGEDGVSPDAKTPSAHIFYVDIAGSLNVTWWPPSEPLVTPDVPNITLQTGQTLFPGTALAAVSPSESISLVFGIGKDQILHMAVYTGESNFSALAPITGLKESDSRLFPHARIDAYSPTSDTVYVATITEINEPCLYILTGSGSDWKLKEPRRYYPNEKLPGALNTSASLRATIESAQKWTFNPFGDIKLGVVEGDLVFWITGVTSGPTRTGMLMNKILTNNFWMVVK